MDAISAQRLSQCHPILQEKIRAMDSALLAEGIVIRVVQGYRSAADQAKIYAQGRTAPGNIVTNAPPGHSMHEFGLAADCEPSLNGLSGPYNPDGIAGSPRYKAMVAAGEAQGLVSGSRWLHPVDWPHLQLPGVPVSPTEQMRSDLTSGGLPLIWQKAISGEYLS